MVKVRLVALGTIVVAGSLFFGLSTLKKRESHVRKSVASASASAVVAESAPLPASSNAANEAPPTNTVGGKDYSVMPDGKPVPELPATAPKSCGFGVVLFTYEGVQFAPRKARTKTDAHELAQKLIAKAEQDFAAAVKEGDPGSLADAGSIGRGILERSIEYRLFMLDKGKVYPEPIETPRGFWVLKRLR
jgi:hypothetical protein